jgi:4a-hydroxytetrahydrobiopterin dehydratase
MPTRLSAALVRDALSRLTGWTGDTHSIGRTVTLTPSEFGDLTERVKVCSDAMNHRPEMHRHGNQTRLRLSTPAEGGVTECDIALASRIDDIVRVVTGTPAPHSPR